MKKLGVITKDGHNYTLRIRASRRVEVVRNGETLRPDAWLEDDHVRDGPELSDATWEFLEHALLTYGPRLLASMTEDA